MKQKMTTTTNYDYFVHTDTSAYKGEWIAIAGKKIIAHGTDAQRVYLKAKQKDPKLAVSLAKVPDEQMMVLRFHQS